MKKLYIASLLLGSLLFCNAQSKINMAGQRVLRQYKLEQQNKSQISPYSTSPIIQEYSSVANKEDIAILVDMNEGATIEDLEAAGGKVLKQREHLAIVSLPLSHVEEFAKSKAVKQVEFGTKMYPKLDKARSATSTDWAHMGLMLDHKYTGEGVIVGCMDQGVDPNHVAFMNSDQSASRVKRVWTFLGSDGTFDAYDTPEKIANFKCDYNTETHGTHVACIMAGGYSDTAIPYYGVAKGADIAISCGRLSDSNILYGVENIIEYAEAEGKPAVVNLSLGNNIGPHDGTDLFSQYLDILGKYAVICCAAGNEGDANIVMHKKFTESDKQIKTFVVETVYEGLHAGDIEVWGADDKTFAVTPTVYDVVADTVVYKFPTIDKSTVIEGTNQVGWYYVANGSQYDATTDIYDENFNKAFAGSRGSYIGVSAAVDSYNNRFCIGVEYYLQNATTNNGNYVMALVVEGNPEQEIHVYTDGNYSEFSSKDKQGWDSATQDGTISNMACAKNVIAVGSFNSRGYATEAEGTISSFTSYGNLIDGRQLPHICAPGCMVFSAFSIYYVNYLISQGYKETDFGYNATVNGVKHYWGGMGGTSQASPYMAGAVALWLEANPYLDRDDILEIAQKSAKTDKYVDNPSRWGAGKLEVLAGLKLAIESVAGVNNVIPDEKRLILTNTGMNQYEVYVAGENKLNVALYNAAGQFMSSETVNGDTANIDASGFEKGVYILTIKGETTNYSERILVK